MGITVKSPQRVSLLVSSLLSIAAGVAPADPAGTGAGNRAAAERGDALEEIVVTAEKRSSTVQDTPISMTALSGELLQQEGISDISGIIQAVPGISQRTAGARTDRVGDARFVLLGRRSAHGGILSG